MVWLQWGRVQFVSIARGNWVIDRHVLLSVEERSRISGCFGCIRGVEQRRRSRAVVVETVAISKKGGDFESVTFYFIFILFSNFFFFGKYIENNIFYIYCTNVM